MLLKYIVDGTDVISILVGTVSIMTRALAGIIKQSLVVSLPGSPNAVKLGIDIILKELMHILNLIRK